MSDRNMTKADIDALVAALVPAMIDPILEEGQRRFTSNVGKGAISLAWSGFVMLILALSAYGVWRQG
jgi:hypothetical protein